MQVVTRYKGDKVLQLEKALLFYKGHDKVFATMHPVEKQGSGMALGAGEPLELAAIHNLLVGLGKGLPQGMFLPGRVLSCGVGTLAWWTPSAQRLVWCRKEKDSKEQINGLVPHPGLVFVVSGGSWSVFAVKGDHRPTPETQLFQAPYFNVYDHGKICLGNIVTPGSCTPDTIDQWDEAFFGTLFTHPNTPKMIAYEGGAYQFWADLIGGKFSAFPEEFLVEQRGVTLGSVLCGLRGGE